jgi:tetratricopeptide (TPR) repeat protein
MPGAENHHLTTPPVLAYARLLRQSHELIARGLGDSPEAEAWAEHMDEPWYAMTTEEQRRMRGLSADLYALREGGPKRVEMSPEQFDVWQRHVNDVCMQSELGNVDVALEFLRQPIPANLPAHFIPVLQGRCWERLGDLETALVFLKEAEKGTPDVTLPVLTLLQRLGRLEEAEAYADKLIARPDSGTTELYAAASAHVLRVLNLSDEEAAPTLRRMVPVLERAQATLATSCAQTPDLPGLDPAIAIALGHCYEELGDAATALQVYSAALERNPGNPDLLVSRGLARYGQSVADAFHDFRQALRSGTRSIWPAYLLSRHALAAGASFEALRLALDAAEYAGPSEIRAEVYETIAIAQARLGQPVQLVLQNLATGALLDPANESIRRNRAVASALAEMLAPPRSPEWQRLTIRPLIPDRLRLSHSREIAHRQNALLEVHRAA